MQVLFLPGRGKFNFKMALTIKEFYERWEVTEGKLIELTASRILSLNRLAEEHLKELHELKKDIDVYMNNPKANIATQIRGLQTESFGVISFETMEEFADNYHKFQNDKYLKQAGAVF